MSSPQATLRSWGSDPGQMDLAYRARLASLVSPLYGEGAWFDLEVSGWENLPTPPAYLVSNHSGGTTIPDVWGLMVGWARHFGESRPIHPLAHDMVFAVPTLARRFARLGVLRARPGMGDEVLRVWKRDLLVCPGGDRDTWRPYKDRYKVNFAGRTGYARLALSTGVPVTPVANGGAHESLVVLTDGRRFAQRLGLPRHFRAEIFPVHLSLPWGLAIGPWPTLPWPVFLRYRIGPPVPFPAGARPGEAPSEAMVAEYDRRVRAALQGLLDELAATAEPLATRVGRMVRRVRGAPRVAPATNS